MSSSSAYPVQFLVLALVLVISPVCRAQGVVREVDRGGATRSVTVSWADLNLAAPAGTRALYGRIRNAAHVVCTALEVDREYDALFVKHCFEQAVDAAVAKVADPRLAALHRVKSSRATAPRPD
jgi:UrcA family protein